MSDRITVDLPTLTYFIHCAAPGYDPYCDLQRELSEERKSIYRIVLNSVDLCILPSVEEEYMKISNTGLKHFYKSTSIVNFTDIEITDKLKREYIKNKLKEKHNKDNDCYAVAEAEIGEMDYFLTFDKVLKKNLKGETTLKIIYPSEYWMYLENLNIDPIIVSDESTPKLNEEWWINP
jgi:hypothetical protein